ncbi:MAG: hypothetical protein AABW88_01285 [Nanoarchaeota archaeon]
MNRKGFELSINFIVALILAIVVFGFGLYFVQKVFNEANEIKAQLDKDSERNINALLDRGDKVAFPVTSKDIKSGQAAIFGLGVLNVNDDTTTFSVEIVCSIYITKGGASVDDSVSDKNCAGKWTTSVQPFTLAKNDRKSVPIAIQAPNGKPSGTYAFTVKVKDVVTGNIYGGAPKQIYVNLN